MLHSTNNYPRLQPTCLPPQGPAFHLGRAVACWGILIWLVTAVGCQREQQWKLIPIKGVVTRDGRPLAGVQVIFWPDVERGTKGPRSSGFTDAAGRYELRTDAGERGAMAGGYRVCILDAQTDATEEAARTSRSAKRRVKKRSQPKITSQTKTQDPSVANEISLPPEYKSFGKTPLRAEILSDVTQTLDFNIS